MKTKPIHPALAFAITVLMAFTVLPACAQQVVTNLSIPSDLGQMAVNPTLHKIYLAGGSPAQMVEINGTTFSQTGVGSGCAVDVDLTNNNYWSTALYSGYADAWNSSDSLVGEPYLGECPIVISVDSAHRVVWVGAQCGGGDDGIWAIDADTHAVIDGPIGSGGTQGGQFLVNPATGRLYIDPNGVSKRVNPSTYAVTANAFGVLLGVNASANLIYALGSTGDTLQIINAAPDPEVILTNVTLNYPAGGSFIGVNPVLNRIYVPYSGTNIIGILNATTGQTITNFSLGAGVTSVQNIAVDAGDNRVYAYNNAGSAAYLAVIQDGAVSPPPPLNIAPFSNQSVVFWPASGAGYTLQTITNLSSTNWVTVSNGAPIIGVVLTNNLPATFFRLH